MSVGAFCMAYGGLWFLLLRSLYLITFVFINFVFSMNLFRIVSRRDAFGAFCGYPWLRHKFAPACRGVPSARRQGAEARGLPACRRHGVPINRDPRFDHNLIGERQICRIGTYLSAGCLAEHPSVSWQSKEKSMKSFRCYITPILLFILAISGCKNDDNPLSTENIPSYLTGQVIDLQGKPVEGCGVHYIYTMTTSSLAKAEKTCPSTVISYQIPKRSKVTLKIFRYFTQDSIATLVDDTLNAGSYSAQFDATSITNGIYIYQLRADTIFQEKFMAICNTDISVLVNTTPLLKTNSSGIFSLPYGVLGFGKPFAGTSSTGSPVDSVYVSHTIQIVLAKTGYLTNMKTIAINEVNGMTQTFTLIKQ